MKRRHFSAENSGHNIGPCRMNRRATQCLQMVGIFSSKKSQFGYNFQGLGMENVGIFEIFNRNLVDFLAIFVPIWYTFSPFWYHLPKTLASLVRPASESTKSLSANKTRVLFVSGTIHHGDRATMQAPSKRFRKRGFPLTQNAA
jgi:hypothetical protein